MAKKILIIHHANVVGGALIALFGLIEELKKENEVVVFSIFEGEGVSYLEKAGVKVIVPQSKFYQKRYSMFVHSEAAYFDLVDQWLKLKALILYFINKYFYALPALKEHVDGVDIVYLNSVFISDWSYAAKKLNKKVIVHVREPLSRKGIGYKIIRTNIKKHCDKVIAVSKDNASRLDLEHLTSVVYDPVVLKNRSVDHEILLDKNIKYFVYVGGDARIKGFEQLVNALEYLDDNIRIFFLGGSNTYSNNLIKRFIRKIIDPFAQKHTDLHQKLKLSNKIIYVGLTDQVFSYYNKSSFLISPFSKPHACLPVLEAFSCKLPVIVSNVEGMDEIVDSSNGLFFKNNNPKSLAKQINFAASIEEKDYLLMSENSFSKYQQLIKSDDKINDVILKI